MEPIIYSTRKAETGTTPMHDTKGWETILVQFGDCVIVDTCSDESRVDGVDALPCSVSKFGGLSEYVGATCHGATLDSCKRSVNRMLRKAWGVELDEVVSDGKTLSEMHASLTDESVHEQFKEWAASLF